MTNQTLLVVGIARSRRGPDSEHPYGFGRSRYIWALLSAAGVLFIGCGVSVVRGAEQLWSPEPLEHLSWGIVILLGSLVAEGVSLAVGLSYVDVAIALAMFERATAEEMGEELTMQETMIFDHPQVAEWVRF